MEKITFKNIELLCDKELTRQIYSNKKTGSPEECNCSDCLRFIGFRDKIYTEEIKKLFIRLGIDYKKEAEIYYNGLVNDLHNYSGWFHFVGSILKNSPKNNLDEFKALEWPVLKINNNLHIGFTTKKDLCFKEFKEYSLVQVEFYVNII